MLNNISNFFNLIRGRKVKKTLAPNDMIAIGVRNSVTQSDYQPSAIFFKDLETQIAAGVTPVTPTLQDVVNQSNSLNNFGGIGQASITSVNFTNNRALYLNNDNYPAILLVDNLNTANTLQIDIDTLKLDGVSYNWSSIVNQLPSWLEYNATDRTIWNNGQGDVTSNTSFGDAALKLNGIGFNNTAIGKKALSSLVNGNNNTALGSEALLSNTNNNNTAVGYFALTNNTTGFSNVALGASSLVLNTVGRRNTAVGQNALLNNISDNNTAVGQAAMTSNTTGTNNLAVGNSALQSNMTGNNNTAIGSNTLINSTENSNVGLGRSVLVNLISGSRNTAIGTEANVANTVTNGSTMIGFGATATGDNQFVVGSTSVNAGLVTTEVNTSTQVWNVIINGVARKILLA